MNANANGPAIFGHGSKFKALEDCSHNTAVKSLPTP